MFIIVPWLGNDRLIDADNDGSSKTNKIKILLVSIESGVKKRKYDTLCSVQGAGPSHSVGEDINKRTILRAERIRICSLRTRFYSLPFSFMYFHSVTLYTVVVWSQEKFQHWWFHHHHHRYHPLLSSPLCFNTHWSLQKGNLGPVSNMAGYPWLHLDKSFKASVLAAIISNKNPFTCRSYSLAKHRTWSNNRGKLRIYPCLPTVE